MRPRNRRLILLGWLSFVLSILVIGFYGWRYQLEPRLITTPNALREDMIRSGSINRILNSRRTIGSLWMIGGSVDRPGLFSDVLLAARCYYANPHDCRHYYSTDLAVLTRDDPSIWLFGVPGALLFIGTLVLVSRAYVVPKRQAPGLAGKATLRELKTARMTMPPGWFTGGRIGLTLLSRTIPTTREGTARVCPWDPPADWAKSRRKWGNYLGIDPRTKLVLRLPRQMDNLHMLVLGGTGAGKTSTAILPMIFTNALEGCSAVVLDLKYPDIDSLFPAVEFYRARGLPVLKYTPFDPTSAAMDLIGRVNDSHDALLAAEQVITPTGDRDTDDSGTAYYKNIQRRVLGGMLLAASQRGNESLGELYRIANKGVESIRAFIYSVAEARDMVGQTLEASPADARSAAQQIASELALFSIEALAKSTTGENWEIEDGGFHQRSVHAAKGIDILFERPSLLYIGIPDVKLHSSQGQALLRLINRRIDQSIKRYREEHSRALPIPLKIYLDEFANFGRIPQIGRNLATMRSFNVQYILGVQNIHQIIKEYGISEAKSMFESNVPIQVYFPRSLSGETAQMVSEIFGEHTVVDQSRGVSRRRTGLLGTTASMSTSEREVARSVLPYEAFATYGKVSEDRWSGGSELDAVVHLPEHNLVELKMLPLLRDPAGTITRGAAVRDWGISTGRGAHPFAAAFNFWVAHSLEVNHATVQSGLYPPRFAFYNQPLVAAMPLKALELLSNGGQAHLADTAGDWTKPYYQKHFNAFTPTALHYHICNWARRNGYEPEEILPTKDRHLAFNRAHGVVEHHPFWLDFECPADPHYWKGCELTDDQETDSAMSAEEYCEKFGSPAPRRQGGPMDQAPGSEPDPQARSEALRSRPVQNKLQKSKKHGRDKPQKPRPAQGEPRKTAADSLAGQGIHEVSYQRALQIKARQERSVEAGDDAEREAVGSAVQPEPQTGPIEFPKASLEEREATDQAPALEGYGTEISPAEPQTEPETSAGAQERDRSGTSGSEQVAQIIVEESEQTTQIAAEAGAGDTATPSGQLTGSEPEPQTEPQIEVTEAHPKKKRRYAGVAASIREQLERHYDPNYVRPERLAGEAQRWIQRLVVRGLEMEVHRGDRRNAITGDTSLVFKTWKYYPGELKSPLSTKFFLGGAGSLFPLTFSIFGVPAWFEPSEDGADLVATRHGLNALGYTFIRQLAYAARFRPLFATLYEVYRNRIVDYPRNTDQQSKGIIANPVGEWIQQAGQLEFGVKLEQSLYGQVARSGGLPSIRALRVAKDMPNRAAAERVPGADSFAHTVDLAFFGAANAEIRSTNFTGSTGNDDSGD